MHSFRGTACRRRSIPPPKIDLAQAEEYLDYLYDADHNRIAYTPAGATLNEMSNRKKLLVFERKTTYKEAQP